jgi:hypothetical protein
VPESFFLTFGQPWAPSQADDLNWQKLPISTKAAYRRQGAAQIEATLGGS